MTGTVEKIISLAKGEVGYHESRARATVATIWTNHEKYAAQVPGMAWVSTDGQPWCAVFNCWLDVKAGLKGNEDFPLTASCDVAGNWFKAHKRWSEYPAVGAWVLFGTKSDLNHTGRVVAYDDNYIWTVEGNTNDSGAREGDGVYAKKHGRRETRVQGYGYPKFSEGIKSADPKWASKAPAPAPKPKPVPAPIPAPVAKSPKTIIHQLRVRVGKQKTRIANQRKKIGNLLRRLK